MNRITILAYLEHSAHLSEGTYGLQYFAPDGYTWTTSAGVPGPDGSYPWDDNGWTDNFELMAVDSDAACTLDNANAGYVANVVEPPEPTIAEDDFIEGIVGKPLMVDFLANDLPCEGSVSEVDILSHNVPGVVTYDANSGQIKITGTTGKGGTYKIKYGIRGGCGTYDTAVIKVKLTVPEDPGWRQQCFYTHTIRGLALQYDEHSRGVVVEGSDIQFQIPKTLIKEGSSTNFATKAYVRFINGTNVYISSFGVQIGVRRSVFVL